MEYIVIIVASIITIILLKIGLNIRIKDIKKVKEIGYDKELNTIANKFPENKEICENILKKLNNTDVKIEEDNETKTSLYIAVTNKIIIANMKDTFARIQTIAHECLHSIQNRTILMFNFIFSNIFLIYFVALIFLIFFNVGDNQIYILIYIFLSLIYCVVRGHLENEAMSKAMYVAKEYMQEYQKSDNNISDEDIKTIVENYDRINKIGIPLTDFVLVSGTLIKIILLSIIAVLHWNVNIHVNKKTNRANFEKILTFINKKGYNEYNNRDTRNVSCPNQMLAATLFCGVQMHRWANVTRNPTCDK